MRSAGAPRPPGGGDPPLGCVLLAPTEALVGEARGLMALLDARERQRLDRLRLSADRDTFLVAHLACRLLLARLTGGDAGSLRFARRAHPGGAVDGKPWCLEAPGLDFSLSHTRGCSAVAVSDSGLVGVDIESTSRRVDVLRLLGRVATPAERQEIEGAPLERRGDAFLQMWTRKEACAKAVGVGLGAAFSRFAVGPGGPSPRSSLGSPGRSWTCEDLDVPVGFAGAVAFSPALAGPAPRPRVLQSLDL